MSLVQQIILGKDVCQFWFPLNCFSVDDASTFEYLQSDLDKYMSQFDNVEILRLSSRQGLIRARLEGVNHANAPVLTFLDSHCECLHGWLEPLLSRIRRNSSTVVCPAIDAISEETFKYNFQLHAPVGGFDWNMRFNWHAVPGHEVGDTFLQMINLNLFVRARDVSTPGLPLTPQPWQEDYSVLTNSSLTRLEDMIQVMISGEQRTWNCL